MSQPADRIPIGLDGEMSGPDPLTHRLIEIGLCLDAERSAGSRIGWNSYHFDPEALDAIGWSAAEIGDGPRAPEVDATLADWLRDNRVGPRALVPVGWGVSTFDLPFVRVALPRTAEFLSHHSIELNAVCYTLSGTRSFGDDVPDMTRWKAMARTAAETFLTAVTGAGPRWHDARFDAQAAWVSWQWLRTVAAGRTVDPEKFVPASLPG